MHPLFELLANISICLITSAAILAILNQSLLELLKKLCPDENSAQFWLNYAKATLTLFPLLLSLCTQWAFKPQTPVDNIRLVLISCLTGLICGLIRMEVKVSQHIWPHRA